MEDFGRLADDLGPAAIVHLSEPATGLRVRGVPAREAALRRAEARVRTAMGYRRRF